MTIELPASASVYSQGFLRYGYDVWVLGISNHLAWRIPTRRLREFFEAHAQQEHLEAAVGSGYFPDRCRFPSGKPDITLLDVNPACLRATARRIARYQPRLIVADILKPMTLPDKTFKSIHIGYLLHCLPGPMMAKGCVFENLKPHLHPDGVLFGSTLLPDGGNWMARKLTQLYNRRGIFGNAQDTLEELHEVLRSYFPRVAIERIGQAVLFACHLG
jgi:ubiquinone/menaquinone biosynthesis C-methylase UbiE